MGDSQSDLTIFLDESEDMKFRILKLHEKDFFHV